MSCENPPQEYWNLIPQLDEALSHHFSVVYGNIAGMFTVDHYMTIYYVVYRLVCNHRDFIGFTHCLLKNKFTSLYLQHNSQQLEENSIFILFHQHGCLERLIDSMSIFLEPFQRLRDIEQFVHYHDVTKVLYQIVYENFLERHLPVYNDYLVQSLNFLLKDLLKTDFIQNVDADFLRQDNSEDHFFTEAQRGVLDEIMRIISIIRLYRPGYVAHLWPQFEKVLEVQERTEDPLLMPLINETMGVEYLMSVLLRRLPVADRDSVHFKKPHINMKRRYEDVIRIIQERDVLALRKLHRVLHVLYSMNIIHPLDIDALVGMNTMHYVKVSVDAIGLRNIGDFVSFISTLNFYMEQCDLIFQAFKPHYVQIVTEKWFEKMLEEANTELSTFFTRWLMSLYSLDHDHFYPFLACFFEFLSMVPDKDIFLGVFLRASEKRFLHWRCDTVKDEVVSLHLENKLSNHFHVHRFKIMLQDLRNSEQLYAGTAYVLTSSVWSTPVALAGEEKCHPQLQEVLDLYGTMYSSVYDQRTVRWDLHYTLACIELSPTVDVILPCLALNVLLQIEQGTLATKELGGIFWINYLSRYGLLRYDRTQERFELTTEQFCLTQKESTVVLPVPASCTYFSFLRSDRPIHGPRGDEEEEHRPEIIQAFIVRFLKKYGETPATKVLDEVRNAITLFPVTETLFEKQVFSLIDREYIEKTTVKDLLRYLP